MWPYLFGSGWIWDVMVSAGLVTVTSVGFAVLLSSADRSSSTGDAGRDPVQTIWHRYEEGDLTSWEFARLMSPRPAVQYTESQARNTAVNHRAAAH